jgi:hypothetical protein
MERKMMHDDPLKRTPAVELDRDNRINKMHDDPNKRLGDAPIEPKYHELMNKLAIGLDEFFNGDDANPRALGKDDKRKTGFVLLVFPFGDHSGRCNFISNGADRKDVVTLMREMISRFEGQPETKGHG